MIRWWSALVIVPVSGAALACTGLGGGVEWPDETTWTCGGADNKTLQGVTKVVDGKDLIAIEAGGSCQLTLIDCDITADFGIKAAGNAKVTIRGGRIHGRQQALQAWGNSVITIEGATIEGEKVTTGKGRFIEH